MHNPPIAPPSFDAETTGGEEVHESAPSQELAEKLRQVLPGVDLGAYIVTETTEGVTLLPNLEHPFWSQNSPYLTPPEKRSARVWDWTLELHGQPFTKKGG